MILPIVFCSDLPSMANQVPDKSNAYVFDLRLAIHGQKRSACLRQADRPTDRVDICSILQRLARRTWNVRSKRKGPGLYAG